MHVQTETSEQEVEVEWQESFHRTVVIFFEEDSSERCLEVRTMSIQTTLFGRRKVKPKFFQRVDLSPDRPNTYYDVVEALWTLAPGDADKQTFFAGAQRSWKEKYAIDSSAREELLKEAAAARRQSAASTGSERLLKSYFEPADKCSNSEKTSANRSQQTSQPAVLSRIPEVNDGIVVFFDAIGAASNNFFTAEVTGNKTLMKELEKTASSYLSYTAELKYYRSSSVFNRQKSVLANSLQEVDNQVNTLRSAIAQVSNITVNVQQLLTSVGSAQLNRKMEAVTKLCAETCILFRKLQDPIQRLSVRNSQMKSRGRFRTRAEDIRLDCVVDPNTSWDDAIQGLHDEAEADEAVGAPLKVKQLVDAAQLLRMTNVLPLSHILEHVQFPHDTSTDASTSSRIVQQLLKLFPIMSIHQVSTGQWALANMADFTLDRVGNTFADIVMLSEEKVNVSPSDSVSGSSVADHLPRGRHGPKPMYQTIPEVVIVVTDFLQQHGFAAQSRRRSATGNALGVSLAEIRSHLLKTVPALRACGISRTTIHELFVAPRAGTRNAQRYHAVTQARVPGKDNSLRKVHADSHFAFAQVQYLMEFSATFPECCVISCDDMNKVNVGTLAVSRYHQINRFFPVNDAPQYPDHDFPYRNSKIIPSGYMIITAKDQHQSNHHRRARSTPPRRCQRDAAIIARRSRSHSPQRTDNHYRKDKLQRVHTEYPKTGPVHVFCRASKFHSSTSVTHTSDLATLLEEVPELRTKTVLSLVVDGGPDHNPNHLVNFLAYGRLWKEFDLDCLIMCTHAPGQSAFNFIEHAWSVLSRKLTGVTLPNHEPGEAPPSEQHLSEAECRQKEATVFDEAISILCGYWNECSFDTHPVLAHAVASENAQQAYADHGNLDTFVKSSLRHIAADADMSTVRTLLIFLCKHAVRSRYLTMFLRCTDGSCVSCRSLPCRESGAVDLLRANGGRLFTPEPSSKDEGHFMTFSECQLRLATGKKSPAIDSALCSREVVLCRYGCKYVFSSKRDEDRHYQLVHENQRRVDMAKARQEKRTVISTPGEGSSAANATQPKRTCHRCTYEGCGDAFSTLYQLQQHKKSTGHILGRGRPRKS